jgi:hypothetical protein
MMGLFYGVIGGGIILALLVLFIDTARRPPNPYGMSKAAKLIVIAIPLVILLAIVTAVLGLIAAD